MYCEAANRLPPGGKMSISQLSLKSMEIPKLALEEYDVYEFMNVFVSFDFDSRSSRVVNLD